MVNVGIQSQTRIASHNPTGAVSPVPRIPELDGLRGIAILSVVCVHYIDSQGLTAGRVSKFVFNAAALGWSGVDLFFVLSGFLIGGILLDARGSPNYFKTFYTRRFFRIIPIYYAWVLLWIVLVTFAGHTLQAHSNSGLPEMAGLPVYIHFLFLQNILHITYFGLGAAWLSATWSLAVEEQFYLICPWLIRMLSKRSLYVTLFAVLAGTPVLRVALRTMAHVNPGWMYGFMPCRMDALAFGVFAALLWRNEDFKKWLGSHERTGSIVHIVLGLGALCLLIWWPDKTSFLMQSVGYTWLGMFYAVCLLSVLFRPVDVMGKWLRMRWLRSIGIVSYCIYIIHAAVNVVLHSLLLRSSPRADTPKGAVVTVLAALVSYLIAQLSWKFFERPLLALGHEFKYAQPGASLAMNAPTTDEAIGAQTARLPVAPAE